jgi:hypothetical protein
MNKKDGGKGEAFEGLTYRHHYPGVTLVHAAGFGHGKPCAHRAFAAWTTWGTGPRHRLWASRQRTLTLEWTHAPARGPPAAPATTLHHRSLSGSCRCKSRVRGWRGESREKKVEKGRQAMAARRTALLLAVADGRRDGRSARRCLCAVRDAGEKVKGLGLQGHAGSFVPPKWKESHRSDRTATVACRRRRSDGLHSARRAESASRFGGLAVGCWALGPGGRETMVVGCFLPRAEWKDVNSKFINCFNEFQKPFCMKFWMNFV